MKTFDPTKPVQTRDGRKARIICTDATLLNTKKDGIIALITNGDIEFLECFFKDGQKENFSKTIDDLINIPEKKVIKGYLIAYTDGSVIFVKEFPKTSNKCKAFERESIIPIEKEYTIGEGLEKIEEED